MEFQRILPRGLLSSHSSPTTSAICNWRIHLQVLFERIRIPNLNLTVAPRASRNPAFLSLALPAVPTLSSWHLPELNKKMAVASVMASCSGSLLFMPHMISIPAHWPCKSKICHVKIPGSCIQRPISYFRPICASIRSNDHYGLSYGDGFDREPFWLSVVKGIAMCLKSLAVFLAEQPSQLKYIEWPGFQNTLRTSTLTLVLVALLIVALSSIDACLCYILALLLRKTA
ncbi:unnamed protein product [Musa hybrid cultivar]